MDRIHHPAFDPVGRAAGPTRRHALLLAGSTLLLPALIAPARAELVIDLRKGTFQPMPIAVADFAGEGGALVSGIITNNLKRCGYFLPIEKARHPEKNPPFDAAPQFEAWKAAGVQALVIGRVSREGGRLKAEFRLWDVVAGQQIDGQQYFTDPNNSRRVGHIISDAVFTKITGVGGFFDTRVVFVDESGSKEARRKRLAIMDQDGANVRYLTDGATSVVTPRYSPVAQEVTYMAQRTGEQPRVHVLNIETGQRQVVGNFPDMTTSPRFSPNGARIALSLQQGGNANLYAIDIGSRTTQRLTSTAAIDTSPSFAPDGSQIVFESDRGGSQQLYIMGAGGGEGKRISFGQGSYSQPSWSPRGDLIAFTRQGSGAFSIGVMKPDGSGERILTEGFHNEAPNWAPNGQYIMFFRDPGGQSGGKLYMVDITGRVEVPVPTPAFASDPTWSPLLTAAR
ncbi:Tol-Pal system beta propeller repeat protein TolB [Bosea sp. LjRoot237]|uniref:Tol-Pal system beta propeller repeat protein TolB n=1 Tax=Bosea sp. LjRoot237 TaxID=3342292 RepID=UPI003ECD5658